MADEITKADQKKGLPLLFYRIVGLSPLLGGVPVSSVGVESPTEEYIFFYLGKIGINFLNFI
jgi:hypothetical protein